MIMIEKFRNHDMATLDQTDICLGFGIDHTILRINQRGTPRTGGIDQHLATNDAFGVAVAITQGDLPFAILLGCTDTAGPRQDFGTAFAGIHGIQNHKPCIIDPAI